MATQLSEMQQIVMALNKLDEKLSGLLDDMKLELKSEMKQMRQEINENFTKQAAEIASIKDEIDQIHVNEVKIAQQTGEIYFKIEQQDKRIYILEEESRKYNLVIRGVQEKKMDDIKQRTLKWLNELDTPINFIASDLANVFRIGYKKQQGLNRNIFVRFANLSDKLEVMSKIREIGENLKFEENTVQVFMDISKEERAWRYFMKPITKALRDNEIKYNWRPPQQLKFFYKGKMRKITPQIDPVLYLQEIGLIEKDADTTELKDQLLKMGGILVKSSTPKDGDIGGQDSKGTKRKDISPMMIELTAEQKKSREEGEGDGAEKLHFEKV